MLNQCSFIGNLGADPEIRSFNNGGQVCNIRLAVSERWKDKEGNRQESTEWVTVAIFSEGLVKVAQQYLKKGSKIFVQGALKTRKYQAQDGSDRYSTEIVLRGFNGTLTMLDGPSGQSGGATSYNGDPKTNGSGSVSSGSIADDLDDDIAF